MNKSETNPEKENRIGQIDSRARLDAEKVLADKVDITQDVLNKLLEKAAADGFIKNTAEAELYKLSFGFLTNPIVVERSKKNKTLN